MKPKAKQTARRVLTYEEAAAMLGCKRPTVHRVVARGDLCRALTGRRLGGNGHKEIGVTRASLKQLLAWRKPGSTGPAQRTLTRGKPERPKLAGGGAGELVVRNASSGALVRIIVGDFIIEVRRADGS
jgi:excisionase family DNA binding protein